jgi:hypothetical protein
MLKGDDFEGVDARKPACGYSMSGTPSPSGKLQVMFFLGGVPRAQKMLMGHLPRVIHHQAHEDCGSELRPLSRDFETSQTSKARFWPPRSGEDPQKLWNTSLSARRRFGVWFRGSSGYESL